ncbi:cobalt-precorrin-8X methylmutase [Phormidium sp. CCY1219]|uniref:cobalt-precorrin-8X methylmutase n=1 Tax=Phormidium sp. CCY1219 TaxID=2886104 RepID=UPI002D1EBB35|nr:cobalt-precorrin-8X methylmutase [Phormidium sp. CCY1219]MEB3830497.1 cobalt-precorrin-8X methylmutase [Phormidium sp. CCY1219]
MHPIMEKSFAIIDSEMGEHHFTPAEYAIVRRVIHSSADFEFKELIRFSPGAIASGIEALRRGVPVVTDVSMVKQGVKNLIGKTLGNPVMSAVERVPEAPAGKTRTETGILQCWEEFPGAIYAIGNAPTALLALCEKLSTASTPPALVIGAPVGFVSVVESKQVLAQLSVPQIRIAGRKGGSPVTAAIVNALIVLALEQGEG